MLMEGWIGLEEIQLCLCWLSKAPTLGWFKEALMTPVFSHWRPLSCSWKDGLDKRKSNKDLSNNTQSHILSEWSISGHFKISHTSRLWETAGLKIVSIELYCTLLCSCFMPRNGWKGGGPAMQCHIFAMVLAITREDSSRVQEHCNSNLLLHFMYYWSSTLYFSVS